MLFSFRQTLAVLLGICASGILAATTVHDETFVPDVILRVTAHDVVQSCMPAKHVVLINGTSPGPELRLLEDRTYWIRVYNDMPDANLTMHWHGLSMAASPFSDGSPYASQWPIPPLYFFDYEVHPEAGMAGTYFYHSHVGFQGVSATGPLIIEDVNTPYHYDEEKIIFLQDVFVGNDSTIEAGLVANPLIWSGETQMILINGKSGGTANGTACNASLSTINVQPGKTYRFRFVGSTALSFVTLAIEGHEDLVIIEADGSYTQPHSTNYLEIGSGERYSILFKAKRDPHKSQFYMQFESRDRPTLTRSYAVLNYGLKSNVTKYYPPATVPLTLPTISYGFVDYKLRPFFPKDVDDFPTAAEVTRRVIIKVHQRVSGPTIWLQNNLPWNEGVRAEPYLVSLYKKDNSSYPDMTRALANNGIDPNTTAFPAQIGEVLEIVIQNTGADKGGLDVHPWHAHGGHYYDLGAGNGTYNATENEIKLAGNPPVKRDTTMLYKYAETTINGTDVGWRAWRLRVKQPGVWMIHCHILQHMVMGMQTVWVMGNETEVLGQVPEPDDVEGYLTYGGSVYGNEYHWPQVVHFQDGAWIDNQK